MHGLGATTSSGRITAEKWHRLEAQLLEEREAAEAAVERARGRTTQVTEDDYEEETLRRLADLRAAVLGHIDHAPDLDALRRLLHQLLTQVVYHTSERSAEAVTVPTSDGCNIGSFAYGGQAVLLSVLRQETIAGWQGDPLETLPTARKAPLDLAPYQPVNVGGDPDRLTERLDGLRRRDRGRRASRLGTDAPHARMAERYSQNAGLAV